MFFGLNILKCTTKAPAVDLLRGIKTALVFLIHKRYDEQPWLSNLEVPCGVEKGRGGGGGHGGGKIRDRNSKA